MANGSNTSQNPINAQINQVATRLRQHGVNAGGAGMAGMRTWVRQQAQGLVNAGVAPNMSQAIRMVGQSAQGQGPQRAPWANLSPSEARQMQRAMGQTGDEAGTIHWDKARREYIGSGKSMNINKWLDTEGKDWSHPQSAWTAGRGANRDGSRFGVNDIRNIVNKMDAGMKPLSQTLQLTRMESAAQTLDSFGLKGLSWNQISQMSDSQLNQTFYGLARGKASYTSFMHNEQLNRNADFSHRDVVIEASTHKGVDAIITNNTAEQETIVGRGYDQHITGARWGYINGEKKLILSVNITPNSRSQYKDISKW